MMKKHNSASHTQNKVSQQISKHLSIILQSEVKDPRVGMVTISDVVVSKDLSFAKIYITAIEDQEAAVKQLNKMSGFLRTELSSKLKIRRVPELRFYPDLVAEKSNRIEEILDKIKKESE